VPIGMPMTGFKRRSHSTRRVHKVLGTCSSKAIHVGGVQRAGAGSNDALYMTLVNVSIRGLLRNGESVTILVE
jgi:hypothetical protein